MSNTPKTSSQLAAALVVDVCVPMVAGEIITNPPSRGVELTPEQRSRMRLPMSGIVTVYEAGGAQVFMHLQESTATISYTRGDVEKGLSTIDAALKKAYRQFKQQRDIDHPRGGKRKLRVYAADLSPERHCTVEVDYPTSGGPKKVTARVTGFARVGANGGPN